MAIEVVMGQLSKSFASIRDTLLSLGLTVIEDRPRHDDILLVERLGNLVEDLQGWAEEGCAAAGDAQRASTHPPDLHRARRSLGRAHELYIRLAHRFGDEAVAYGTIDPLLRFGRQRGREWLAWTKGVVQAFESCRAPLHALDEALLQAWQELTERLSTRSLSLQTTNIGQQISSPAPLRAAVRAGTQDEDEFS